MQSSGGILEEENSLMKESKNSASGEVKKKTSLKDKLQEGVNKIN